MGVKVKGHLGVKGQFWGQILKFDGEVSRGHERSFKGHHEISKTPAPVITKLAPRVAFNSPSDIRGVRVKVNQGQRSFWGQILKFDGEVSQGHKRSIQGHHNISKNPAPVINKLAPRVAYNPPRVIRGSGLRSFKVKGHFGVKS